MNLKIYTFAVRKCQTSIKRIVAYMWHNKLTMQHWVELNWIKLGLSWNSQHYCIPVYDSACYLVSTQFPNILSITENLEIGNWVETRRECPVLSVSVVWTSYKNCLMMVALLMNCWLDVLQIPRLHQCCSGPRWSWRNWTSSLHCSLSWFHRLTALCHNGYVSR